MTDKPTMEIDDYGNKFWYLNDKLHREDGPAVEDADGSKYWYLKGKRHREDGPAYEYADGSKEWWFKGKRHRVDGPAIERVDGSEEWWLNDKLHREDGPAIEWSDGSKFWCLNDEYHREDGPAIEWAYGSKEWWLNGEEVTEEEVMGKEILKDTLDVIARLGQDFDASDNVNSPSHYNQSGIECIDAIKASLGDGYQDYCKGNVMKYLWRYKYKNGIEDLNKAQWYLNSMVESVEENND